MEISRRLFDVTLNYLTIRGFSSAIIPINSIVPSSLFITCNKTCVEYVVPQSLCRPVTIGGKPYFPTSCILALFDDVSSYALILQDRNHRPGVSLTLKTELICRCQAGEKVKVLVGCDKIGKSIAFCSMELVSSKGELLARGKHVKYVKMGVLWDILTHSIFFLFVLACLEYYITNYVVNNDKSTNEDVPRKINNLLCDLEVSDITDSFNDASFTVNDVAQSFSLPVSKGLLNAMGSMHGGAMAVAIEKACLLADAKDSQTKTSVGRCIESIDITYIASIKQGDIVILVRKRENRPTIAADDTLVSIIQSSTANNLMIGEVINKKTGAVCCEFRCLWSM